MKNEIIKIAKDLEQGTVTTEQAQTLLLGLFSVRQRIFAIKDTTGDWVKLFADKETADKECEIFAKQHDYVGFYVDEETLN